VFLYISPRAVRVTEKRAKTRAIRVGDGRASPNSHHRQSSGPRVDRYRKFRHTTSGFGNIRPELSLVFRQYLRNPWAQNEITSHAVTHRGCLHFFVVRFDQGGTVRGSGPPDWQNTFSDRNIFL